MDALVRGGRFDGDLYLGGADCSELFIRHIRPNRDDLIGGKPRLRRTNAHGLIFFWGGDPRNDRIEQLGGGTRSAPAAIGQESPLPPT